jgi:hypothetical protein
MQNVPRPPNPQIIEAKTKYQKNRKRLLLVMVVSFIGILVVGWILFNIFGPWVCSISIAIAIILLVMLLVIYFYGFGYQNRFRFYSSILEYDPSAKITKIEKNFFVEKVSYETSGEKYPRNFKIEHFSGAGEYSGSEHFSITIAYHSLFAIYVKRYFKQNIFETDNQNFLQFQNVNNYFEAGDEIENTEGKLIAEIYPKFNYWKNASWTTSTESYNSTINQLLYILQTMNQIQKISQQKGKLFHRVNAPETFSRSVGPRKWTVCITCEKMLGKWTSGDHKNMPKCPSCGMDSFLILGYSENNVLDKIKKIKLYN